MTNVITMKDLLDSDEAESAKSGKVNGRCTECEYNLFVIPCNECPGIELKKDDTILKP